MKQLFILFLLLCSTSVFAQDVIVKKDGSTIVCRVVELTSTEIVYKRWSNLSGSNYVMNRTDASAINYQNGKKVNLSEATNLYMPNNQNDGVQQYNDRALLRIDAASNNPYKKVKTLKTIGWTVGSILTAGGAVLMGLGIAWDLGDDGLTPFCIGSGLVAGGLICTTVCLTAAHRIKKQSDGLVSIPLYQQEFYLGNNSSIDVGIDMLNDEKQGSRTLGLGLRYNF